MIFLYLNVLVLRSTGFCYCLGVIVGRGISRRYLPRPEKFGFQFFIIIDFVVFLFLSSQMALNGRQKKECIDNVFSLLKMKSNAGELDLNINPENF